MPLVTAYLKCLKNLDFPLFEIRSKVSFGRKTVCIWGDCGTTVVKMLCYKWEGSWFDPSWCHWKFSLT